VAADPPAGDSTVARVTIRLATSADFDGILSLAAEVEDLFGEMVDDPGFRKVLTTHIDRSSALVADSSGIVGGLLFDPAGPDYHLEWLVVAEQARGTGVGSALMDSAMERFVQGPGSIEVVTFGPDHPGADARLFYERHGFEAGPMLFPGPEGGSRQMYMKWLPDPDPA
jgi:ribosomal protein S18 acetylase RimI-like enzyme